MNITLRTVALLGAFVLTAGQVEAQELNICEPAGAGARRNLVTLLSHDQTRPSSPFPNLHVVVSIDEAGFAFAVGSIQVRDGLSNTFLVSEKDVRPALSCTDVNQNARAGLT